MIYSKKLDRVGPVDNRPFTDQPHKLRKNLFLIFYTGHVTHDT